VNSIGQIHAYLTSTTLLCFQHHASRALYRWTTRGLPRPRFRPGLSRRGRQQLYVLKRYETETTYRYQHHRRLSIVIGTYISNWTADADCQGCGVRHLSIVWLVNVQNAELSISIAKRSCNGLVCCVCWFFLTQKWNCESCAVRCKNQTVKYSTIVSHCLVFASQLIFKHEQPINNFWHQIHIAFFMMTLKIITVSWTNDLLVTVSENKLVLHWMFD
jgi:hypothetical protein